MPETKPTIAQRVEDARDALDQLCAELERGIRNSEHFDKLEAEATAIGRSLREAFRSGSRA